MKRLLKVAFNISGFLLISIAAIAQSAPLKTIWDDGLKFRTDDGRYKISVGGRVHYDMAIMKHSAALDSAFGKAHDKTEVRRARISFEGVLNNAIAYEFEFTFNETIEFADMYVAFLRLPYFERLTAGHFREPFGMEESTSSNAVPFMERSLTSSFGTSRNLGLMVQKAFNNQQWRFYAGAFRLTDDLGADLEGEGKYSFTSRLAFNPIYDTATNKSLHLGIAVNRFTPFNSTYELETEHEVNTSPIYIKSETAGVRSVLQGGVELGWSYKQFNWQTEYMISKVDHTTGSHTNHGFYTMATYFLNGGRRNYNREGNKYSSIRVKKKLTEGSMKGAWELGARLSYLDNKASSTGILKTRNGTLGINWYYNSNSRIMINYTHSLLGEDHFTSALQCRIQVTF